MTFIKMNGQWYINRCDGKFSASEKFRDFCQTDCKNCKLAAPLNINTWGREEAKEEIDDELLMMIVDKILI